MEISTENSLPRPCHVWQTAASNGLLAGSPPGGARPRRGSVRAPQEAHAHAARVVHLFGAAASLPVRHGGRAEAEIELVCGAGGSAGAGSALAKTLERPGNGGSFTATISSGSAGELRC